MYKNWALSLLIVLSQRSNQLSQTGLVWHVWLVTYITYSSCHITVSVTLTTTTTTTNNNNNHHYHIATNTTGWHDNDGAGTRKGSFGLRYVFCSVFFFYSTNFYSQTTSNHHNGAMNGHYQCDDECTGMRTTASWITKYEHLGLRCVKGIFFLSSFYIFY